MGIAVFLALAIVAAGKAYVTGHGEASVRFHVAGAADARLSISPIAGTLTPGDSVAVEITVSNPSGWTVRVGNVSQASVTELPDGCPAKSFGFVPVHVNRTLGPGESASATGKLAMDRGAPSECAGADPTLSVSLGG